MMWAAAPQVLKPSSIDSVRRRGQRSTSTRPCRTECTAGTRQPLVSRQRTRIVQTVSATASPVAQPDGAPANEPGPRRPTRSARRFSPLCSPRSSAGARLSRCRLRGVRESRPHRRLPPTRDADRSRLEAPEIPTTAPPRHGRTARRYRALPTGPTCPHAGAWWRSARPRARPVARALARYPDAAFLRDEIAEIAALRRLRRAGPSAPR